MICGYNQTIEITMQSRGATFDDQAHLLLSRYPFLLKIILAPIVDSVRSWFSKLQVLYPQAGQK